MDIEAYWNTIDLKSDELFDPSLKYGVGSILRLIRGR